MLKVVIVGLFMVSAASALSCAACTPQQTDACPLLACHKSERVRGQCQCCDKCGQDLGQKCTESDPCYPHLVCYKLDKDEMLPWFYNGICVTNQTFQSLPPEPTPCGPCALPSPLATAPVVTTVPPLATAPVVTTVPPPPYASSTPVVDEKKAIASFVSWVRRHINSKQ